MLDVPIRDTDETKHLVPIVPQLGAITCAPGNITPAGIQFSADRTYFKDLTQIPLIDEDVSYDPAQFPIQEYDADGQQVDLRVDNTWSKTLASVSTVEAAEVHLVNALSPFILNSKLKRLMLKSGDVRVSLLVLLTCD